MIVRHCLESANPVEPKHNLCVANISVASDCEQGDTLAITVGFANHGTFRESFEAVLRDQADDTAVATKTITLGKRWMGKADDVPDLTFKPESTAMNRLGARVCIGGDVNGDNFPDVLLGAPDWQNACGRAYLHFGGPNMDAQADVVFTGENVGDRFSGQSCAFGDVNCDGYGDVIIGAHCYPAGRSDGRVKIYYGGPSMDNIVDVILDGEVDQRSHFGLMLTASDIDHDGYADVIVGAQNYDHGGEYHPFYPITGRSGPNRGRGRVYLYWGGDPMETTPDIIFEGENRGDWFGRRISANGDVNADGYSDVLIGARNAGHENNGSVYLFLGGPKEGMDSICDWTFRGEGKDHQMGSSAAIFDIDTDGYDDVLVGARGAAGHDGRVYIYWGGDDFDGSTPGLILEAPTVSSMGGDDIACGYFNGDRYGDILAGAYGYPGDDYIYGRAYLFYGNTKTAMDTDCDYIFAGEAGKRDFFGFQVSAGDLNDDGYSDALIGAQGAHNGMGRAYLHFGPFHDETDITFNWDTTNASIGKHTLKVEIPPVKGEQNIEDNIKTVEVEIRERAGSVSK